MPLFAPACLAIFFIFPNRRQVYNRLRGGRLLSPRASTRPSGPRSPGSPRSGLMRTRSSASRRRRRTSGRAFASTPSSARLEAAITKSRLWARLDTIKRDKFLAADNGLEQHNGRGGPGSQLALLHGFRHRSGLAGSDDTNGNGGVFRATYNSGVPGYLVWDSTPELALSATNEGVKLPQESGPSGYVLLRGHERQRWDISVCHRRHSRSGNASMARSRPGNLWTNPTVAGEVSESGLRGITPTGGNLLVFPEGTDWGVVQLTA
jgi:hypothetical protein